MHAITPAASRHWWDYKWHPFARRKAPAHLKGTTVCQFIYTSNITIHTLDAAGTLLLNVFSCKKFDSDEVVEFAVNYFSGRLLNRKEIKRLWLQ